MEFIPEWAPNIHPLVIHFPIAFLILAFGANIITFFVSDKWWDELKNTFLYLIGTVSAISVYYTGKAAADSIFLPTEAQSVLNNHADWALWTVWFFGIYAVLRIAFYWLKLLDRKMMRVLLLAIAAPGIFLLYETGEHGGEMVYGYGAGTGQLLTEEPSEPVYSDSLLNESTSSFVTNENGNWRWAMGPNAVTELLQNFHWVSGSVNELSPATVQSEDNFLLKLTAANTPNFFVSHDRYQNVQVDIYLSMSDFNGEIELVHHFLDTENYDYVSLNSDGTVIQGRIAGGSDTKFEEATDSESGMLFIRVVGNGTHFRGYINQQMVVHGHGDAPSSGAAGIRIQGSGDILIDKFELTQLN